MRIGNYTLIQVVSLNTDPKYLTFNADFYHQHEKKEDFKVEVWNSDISGYVQKTIYRLKMT